MRPIGEEPAAEDGAAEREVRDEADGERDQQRERQAEPIRPWPRKTKPGGRLPIELPSVVGSVVYQMAAPEKNIIVVSVTMKGGMLKRVMQAPLSEPMAPPTARKATMPAAIASQGGARHRPAVEGHDRGAEHAGHGEVEVRREVDAGHDQDEGLADGDDQERHHRAQDVAPGVDGATISGTSGTMAAT